MRTNFYIDGFNLYFNAVSDSPYKWLDLGRMCSRIVPDHEVARIRYFTAPVEYRPDHPSQRQRQDTYLRALRTIPNLSIHEGPMLRESSTFQRHIRKRTLADCQFPDTLTDAVGTITKPLEW